MKKRGGYQLLQLEKEPFYELLENQGEVAQGLIKLPTHRLCARMRDVVELRARAGVQAAG